MGYLDSCSKVIALAPCYQSDRECKCTRGIMKIMTERPLFAWRQQLYATYLLIELRDVMLSFILDRHFEAGSKTRASGSFKRVQTELQQEWCWKANSRGANRVEVDD